GREDVGAPSDPSLGGSVDLLTRPGLLPLRAPADPSQPVGVRQEVRAGWVRMSWVPSAVQRVRPETNGDLRETGYLATGAAAPVKLLVTTCSVVTLLCVTFDGYGQG